MNRPNEPAMNDVTDKDLHRKEGVDPYPTPNDTELAGQHQGDLEDPAKVDGDAPHDRGTAPGGGYTTGVDAMKNQLDEEGARDAWKKGRTQGEPPKR